MDTVRTHYTIRYRLLSGEVEEIPEVPSVKLREFQDSLAIPGAGFEWQTEKGRVYYVRGAEVASYQLIPSTRIPYRS